MLSALIRGVPLLVLALAIVVAWGVAVTANVAHAYQLAGLSPWAHVIAAASGAGDVFKAAAAFGFFYTLSARKWGAVLACAIVWVIATGWSVKSLVGFSSTLVTETQLIKEETLKTSRSTRDSIEAELGGLVQQQQWLRGQMTEKVKGANAAERDRIRDERELSLTSADNITRRIDELRQQLAEHSQRTIAGGVVSDPVGRFFAQATGWQTDMLNNVATVIGFLLLVEVGSNLAFLAFAPLFERRRPEPEVLSPAPAPRIAPARAPPKRLGMGLAEIQRRRASPAGAEKRAQAAAYLDDLIALHGAGALVPSADVLGAYPAWAEREGVPPLLPNQVGQQLGCVGVGKVEQEGRVYYALP